MKNSIGKSDLSVTVVVIKVFLNIFIFSSISVVESDLSEFVKWQSISFKDLPNSHDPSVYNASVNVPFGLDHYNGKLFVAIPRRNPGIPATLNVVELKGSAPHLNPLLIGYPNYRTNSLNPNFSPDISKIVSVYRPRVDRCKRLWFVDTGVLEYTDNQINVQRPSIWTIDLTRNIVLRRFEIPVTVVEDGKGLASITIDDDNCNNGFAYIPDWFNNALIVYSTRDNRAWRFNHNFFFFNPFEGDFVVDDLQFQWNDGIFSVALSNVRPDGYKTAFFHALASTGEFSVSTQVLRNEALASRRTHDRDFRFLGRRGSNSQAGSHAVGQLEGDSILFFADMQKSSISCWNLKNPMKPSHIHVVAQDNSTMIYPVDLAIDNDSTLWVLANRLPRFIYDRYRPEDYNFNIFNGPTAKACVKCLNLRRQFEE